MKKYKVSLASLIAFNYELEVEAKNEYEAYEKAAKEFNNGHEAGDFHEVEGADITLDLSDPDKDGDIPPGAYIEEIK